MYTVIRALITVSTYIMCRLNKGAKLIVKMLQVDNASPKSYSAIYNNQSNFDVGWEQKK